MNLSESPVHTGKTLRAPVRVQVMEVNLKGHVLWQFHDILDVMHFWYPVVHAV